jgi:hypothetical protein
MDPKDQARSINRNLPNSHVQSHLVETQENQLSSTEFNNTLHQIRSTYDDMSVNKSIILRRIHYSITFHFRMNFWGHLLEHFLHFILPSTENTDHNIDLSRSPITSNTHSWSTIIPIATLDMVQSDNIGPWWGRRDVYDQTPATFIFTNESLSTSYSIEPITTSQQIYMSIENTPCYVNYYSYSNTCHCCYSSSSS